MKSMLGARATVARSAQTGLLACALCLLAAPAAWAGTWLSPQDLSAPGRSATNPAVAMDDSGATTALWEKDNSTKVGFHGETSTRNPGEAFTAPSELVPGMTEPQVEMTPSGQTIAVWKRLANPPGNYVIEAATRPPGGVFGVSEKVAEMPSAVIPNGLQIAVNGSGDVAVVWTRRDPLAVDKDATFVAGSVRQAGGDFSEPEPISLPIVEEQSASEPAVAIDAAGDATAAWRYNDGTDEVVEAAERPAGASFSTPEVLSEAGEGSFEPEVASSAAGEAIAVWEEFDGTDAVVVASPRPVGGEFGAVDELSGAGENAIGPEIAETPGGSAPVVWTWAEEDEAEIQTSSRPAGESFSPAADVTPIAESIGPVDSDLAMNAAGDAIVAWPGSSSGGASVVKAAVRSGAGSFSAPAEVSATSPDFLHPDVAIDAVGDATVIWSRSDGLNRIAQVAGYDASPPQMRGLSVPPTGTVGVPVAFSASPFDVWPLASTSFTFGDGGGASGTSVSHAYSAPGVYQVTATAVDAAGTPVSASGMIAISPSYQFKIGKLKRNQKKGTATLTVDVSGPGQVAVSGKKVKRKSKRASAAGSVTLSIAAKGKAQKQLNQKGKVKVKVTVTFTPDGGDHAASKAVSVTLKKKLAT